jgi:hypothetical protein
MLAPAAAMATPTQFYINPANVLVTSQVQIDAVNFINHGSFNIGTFPYIPFETFDTLNYTNDGTMLASPGWRFNLNSTVTGLRSWSANFVNANPGLITGLDTINTGTSPIGNPCVIAPVDPSYVQIFATNIVTRAGAQGAGASLQVGPNGEIRLEGKTVDLSRSGLEVLPVWDEIIGTSFINNPPTAFVPDIAILDQEWVSGSYSQQFGLGTLGLWDGVIASAPGIPMNRGAAPAAFAGFSMAIQSPSTADSQVASAFGVVIITNFVNVTNIFVDVTNNCSVTNFGVRPVPIAVTVRSNVVKSAVFVGVPFNFQVPQIGFLPTSVPNNPAQGFPPYQEMSALISVLLSNAVTGQLEPAYIRVDDTLASTPTLRGVIPNMVGCGATTDRPVNYSVDRQPLITGGPGNHGFPEANFLVSSASDVLDTTNIIGDSVTNFTVIVGDYAAYGSLFDNFVSRPPAVANGVVSNTPGRVMISADTLDLTKTAIRGEGDVMITTPHLISSSGAVVDVENLSYNLGSTNGSLKIQSLVPPTGEVQRLRGQVVVWSTLWQNTVVVTLTNNYILTNVPVVSPCDTNTTPAVIGTNIIVLGQTNLTATIQVYYQALMVDATALTTVVPVVVYDLIGHSPNAAVNDNMTLVQHLLLDGTSITLNGNITIPGAIPPNPITGIAPAILPLFDWAAVNAPNVLYFTNNGSLNIFNSGHFGDDRPSPYTIFQNMGTISAGSIDIRSVNYQNSGSISSLFGTTFQGGAGKLENGSSSSGGQTTFLSQSLKLNNYQLTADGGINLSVSNALFDAGPGSGNILQSLNGINLLVKPRTGDLLGTTLQSVTPAVNHGVKVDHRWAALDRGPSPAGFTGNAAVGTLSLLSQSPDPLFFFTGTGPHKAMYVDLLDLSSPTLTDYTNQIAIDNNLIIYYAAARLNFTPPNNTNGIPQEPEEFLDGQFGGHLRWVSSFAGPNSSVTAVVNGQSVEVNRALFNSKIIDSDGDTVPNFYDTDANGPFVGATLTVNIVGNGSAVPNYGGQLLLVGQSYTMAAQPDDGSVFSGWSGSIVTNSPLLTFTMTNGLSFTATFTTVLSPASYNGLFFEDLPTGVEFLRSGAITVTTAKGGKCSGTVEIGKNRYSFTGQLDTNGMATIPIPKGALVLHLQVGGDHVTGTVSDAGLTWTASLEADRAVFSAKTNAAPQAGTYTLIVPGTGDPSNTQVPQGDGYLTVTVDQSGKVSASGTLADNTPVTDSSTLSADGRWPLYVSLYSGGGQILGWIQFGDTGGQDLGGMVSWIKQPNAKAKFYPNGFNIETNATGSAYSSAMSPVTGFSAGQTTLIGGNLSGTIVNDIAVGSDNKVTNLSTNKLTLTITTKTGLFKGSVVDPATGKTIKYNGVLFQKDGTGSGAFFGTDQSGKVVISH